MIFQKLNEWRVLFKSKLMRDKIVRLRVKVDFNLVMTQKPNS
jgi:hypothetical protein